MILSLERFKEGMNLEELALYLGWGGTTKEMEQEFIRCGYKIARILVHFEGEVRRTWARRRGIGKFSHDELWEIDRWMDRYDIPQIIRLCRVHFGHRIGNAREFDLWLMRSNYHWRFTVINYPIKEVD